MSVRQPNERETRIIHEAAEKRLQLLRSRGHKVNAASFEAGFIEGLQTNLSTLVFWDRERNRRKEPAQ